MRVESLNKSVETISKSVGTLNKSVGTLNKSVETVNRKLELSVKEQREFNRVQVRLNRYFLSQIKNGKK
jgi:uncharacterized protein YoxC